MYYIKYLRKLFLNPKVNKVQRWRRKNLLTLNSSKVEKNINYIVVCILDDLSLSSDSLDDDSMEESKTPSPEHTVPESNMIEPIPPSTPLLNDKIKEEPIDEAAVENAAKELFGNDLLFNHDDLHAEEFWNELITSSENSNLLSLQDQNQFLSDDIVEVESSIKMENSSPSTNFFSSAVPQSTLTGF